MATQFALDVPGFYPFTLEPYQGGWRVDVNLEHTTQGASLIAHLHQLLRIRTGAGAELLPEGTLDQARYHKHLYYTLPSPLPEKLTFVMDTERGAEPVSEVVIKNGDRPAYLEPTPDHARYQLAITETRALGMALQPQTRAKIPYSRAARAGFSREIHAPVTDLHTHSTAQTQAKDLLDLAAELDIQAKRALAEGKEAERICYPVGLLGGEFINMKPEPGQTVMKMVGRGFTPMKEENRDWEVEGKKCDGIPVSELTDRQRTAIIRKMQFAPDNTIDFSDMDPQMYRYRNPLAKHPALAKGIIRKIAEDYANAGIRYAELSTASMMTSPEWLEQMIEAIDEIERDGVGPNHTKVTLRFVVNLSRTLNAQECAAWLKKDKYLLRHPYIIGDDLTGYEANKTTDFHWVLSNLLQWGESSEKTDLKPEHGWNFKDWIIHRVHGGETAKNPTNVGDTIDLAHQYLGGRVRIGHALHYALTPAQKKHLAALQKHPEADLFATERCMDGNQVYRSEKLVHDQPPFLAAPRFLGSDGCGAISVTPVGLAYSAIAAGVGLEELAAIRRWEEGYIERQLARDKAKRAAFEQHYGKGAKGTAAFVSGYQAVLDEIPERTRLKDYLPAEFHGKKPLLWVGPSGSSWDSMERMDQETAERAAMFLTRVLNPRTCYPVLGRVQKAGSNAAFDRALLKYNQAHPDEKFAVLSRYSGADKRPTGEMAESLSWVQAIPGELDQVPSNMIRFIRQHGGKAVVLAGSDFSAAMVGLSEDQNVAYAMQVPKKGMFLKLAQTVATRSRFADFDQFVEQLFEQVGPGHLFSSTEERDQFLRPGIDLKKVAAEVKNLPL